MITRQLPERQSQWASLFSNEKKLALDSRERRRKKSERERKAYFPKFVHSSSVTGFIDRERELEPIPYVEETHGCRNTLCSVCNAGVDEGCSSIGCDLCPSIAHSSCVQSTEKSCLQTNMEHFTEIYRAHVMSKVNANGIWSCLLCSKEITTSIDEERSRLSADRFKRLAFFSAMKLQASCMRHKAQSRYQVLYNGMLKMQARVSNVCECITCPYR